MPKKILGGVIKKFLGESKKYLPRGPNTPRGVDNFSKKWGFLKGVGHKKIFRGVPPNPPPFGNQKMCPLIRIADVAKQYTRPRDPKRKKTTGGAKIDTAAFKFSRAFFPSYEGVR